MADPTVLTAFVGTAAGIIGAAAGIIGARSQKSKDDEDRAEQDAAGTVASWAGLNAALDREIRRLHEDMDRLRDEYERHLEAARHRISELEEEVRILRRTLRGESPP